jgi:hypothetical protein
MRNTFSILQPENQQIPEDFDTRSTMTSIPNLAELRIKDKYARRNLPFVIASAEFHDSEFAGLVAETEEEILEIVVEDTTASQANAVTASTLTDASVGLA